MSRAKFAGKRQRFAASGVALGGRLQSRFSSFVACSPASSLVYGGNHEFWTDIADRGGVRPLGCAARKSRRNAPSPSPSRGRDPPPSSSSSFDAPSPPSVRGDLKFSRALPHM